MRNFKRRALGALAAAGAMVLLAVAGGCATSGCLDNQSSLPLAGFYSSATGHAVTVNSVDIGGIGAPNDSLLIHNGQEVSTLYLPLRSNQSTTQYFIRYHFEVEDESTLAPSDTITFGYTSSPYFASEECGAMFTYNINHLGYTRHLIDSVVITDSLITNVDAERIKIYLRE